MTRLLRLALLSVSSACVMGPGAIDGPPLCSTLRTAYRAHYTREAGNCDALSDSIAEPYRVPANCAQTIDYSDDMCAITVLRECPEGSSTYLLYVSKLGGYVGRLQIRTATCSSVFWIELR